MVEQLEGRIALTGTWTKLTSLLPVTGSHTGNMMLLSNGTVILQGGVGSPSNSWFELKPNATTGKYVDGSWLPIASMNLGRMDYASVTLPSGEVMVMGGEYSGAKLGPPDTFTHQAEIYNPATNTWTQIKPVPGNRNFGDESAEVLPNGTVLVSGGFYPKKSKHYASYNTKTFIYNPTAGTWSNGPARLNDDYGYEENWVKLPDGSILSAPTEGTTPLVTPQRFVPGSSSSAGSWVATANLPSPLAYAPGNAFKEMGPPILLPDGQVWQVGGNDLTALYTPPSTKAPLGSWKAGPRIPQMQGTAKYALTGADVPAAMMPNGDVLFAASPWLKAPTYFYVFDPTANSGAGSITPISPPGGGASLPIPGWETSFLVLPTGQILYDQRQDNQLWLFSPNGAPDETWRPRISSIVASTTTGAYTLTGTQLNGMSEGAIVGDDAEMATNFPIVTLTASNGTVSYATTFNWSSTGVQTGTAAVTTQFTLPTGIASGTYQLCVIASGISSAPFSFKVS